MKIIKNYKHNTVLLKEAIKSLNINPNGIYLDSTFGHGGHSKIILSNLNKYGKLFAIDCDLKAIEESKIINDNRFNIIHGKFSNMLYYMSKKNLIGKINGIIFDLGISSNQIDNPERGFSFKKNGPLDMRMDNKFGKSAAEWLKKASLNEIVWVLKKFGEERYSKNIAKSIIKNRIKKPIINTNDLSKLIINCYNYFDNKKRIKHPATRSFQAIRIHINNEIKELKKALKSSLILLAPKGRLTIISFHSLEDKIVKNFFKKCNFKFQIPNDFPLTEKQILEKKKNIQQLRYLGKIVPSDKEIYYNTRSRSAILRYAEKI